MADYAIETVDLTKRYGRKLAVDNLSFSVPTGSVFAFLGRNGAGKTTAIKILLNILDRTSGEARVLGMDSARDSLRIKGRTGYVAEAQRMYDWMKVDETVWFCKQFYASWDDAFADGLKRRMELPGVAGGLLVFLLIYLLMVAETLLLQAGHERAVGALSDQRQAILIPSPSGERVLTAPVAYVTVSNPWFGAELSKVRMVPTASGYTALPVHGDQEICVVDIPSAKVILRRRIDATNYWWQSEDQIGYIDRQDRRHVIGL